MLKYDGLEYDLDNLFQYEMLKKLIEALAKNQQKMNQRIFELENRENGSTEKGNNYHHQKEIKGKANTSINDITLSSNLNDSLNENLNKKDSHIENNGNDDQIREGEVEEDVFHERNDYTNKELLSKIISIEKKIKEVPIIRKLIKSTEKKIDSQNASLQSVSEKVEVNNMEINEMKKDLDDIKLLLRFSPSEDIDDNEQFNVKDINNDNKGDNKDDNAVLIKKLEMKMIKKFSFVDERTKAIEIENRKTKQEQGNIKIRIEQMLNEITQQKNDLNKNNKDMIEMINDKTGQLDIKLSEKIDSLVYQINMMKQEEASIPQNTVSNIQEQETPKVSNDKEVINHMLHKLNRKLNELEKGLSALKDSSNSNINDIRDSILKLESNIPVKTEKSENSNITDQLCQLGNKLSELRDFTEALEKNVYSQGIDMKALAKKIENVTGTILSLQDGPKDKKSSDGVKFVALRTYNTEIAKITKDIDSICKLNDDFRKQITENQSTIANLISKNDLNNLDKTLRTLIEELKVSFQKKFSNKSETNKSIKSIDQQLKQLLLEIGNRTEKADTCMLASKPIGYKCASCEAEIDNFEHNKINYLPWKNYPLRDYEKSYRVSYKIIINSKEMVSVGYYKN